MKDNMNKKTHLTGLMNDSKWVRIFALITGAWVITRQRNRWRIRLARPLGDY